MNRHQFIRTLALSAALTAAWGPAVAQTPGRTVRLVVPFPAGGATDLFARALQTRLSEALGANVVVDNKPGAGGSLGADIVAKAPADGLTLLLATSSTHAIGPALSVRLPYNTVTDFTPIVHVGNAPSLMLVPNNSPAQSVKEWIELARRQPGRLNYGSSGNGTIVHVDALDAADAGERIGALRDDLAGALLGQQVHHHPGLLGTDGQVHRAAHGGDGAGLAGAPVGQVARGRHLEGAQHADVEVAAAHHGEAVGVVEERAAGQQRHGLLAGVDEVVVFAAPARAPGPCPGCRSRCAG
jgi:hypothetical protein